MHPAAAPSMPLETPRRFTSAYQAAPRTHLLSNGHYSVMLTTAGSGFSRWQDIALTRWREDPTCDPWGSYIFLRDVFNGHVWSAGYQPVGRESEIYEVDFFEDRAEFRRKDGPIRTVMQVMVSPEDDAEVRHLSLSNEGRGVREIELTSYAEVVLSPAAADSAHPAFSKMFVQTEFVAERGALLATRRPRDPGQPQLWLVHFNSLDGEAIGGLQFETDRARFLGRGHGIRNAASIMEARPLSGSVGTVLDPVVALRRRVRIDPGETVHAAFWTGIGASRAQALKLVDKLGSDAAFQRTQALARTRAAARLRDLDISGEDAGVFQELAQPILYSDASLRAATQLLDRNQLGQPALWALGVSGDSPIVLALIGEEAGIERVVQLLRAQAYWQAMGLAVDLVILNTAPPRSRGFAGRGARGFDQAGAAREGHRDRAACRCLGSGAARFPASGGARGASAAAQRRCASNWQDRRNRRAPRVCGAKTAAMTCARRHRTRRRRSNTSTVWAGLTRAAANMWSCSTMANGLPRPGST